MDPVGGLQSVGIVPASLVDVVEVTIMQDIPCIKQVQDPVVAETAAGVAAVFVQTTVRAHEGTQIRVLFPVPGHIMSPALVQPQVLCRCVLMENMIQAIVLTEPVGVGDPANVGHEVPGLPVLTGKDRRKAVMQGVLYCFFHSSICFLLCQSFRVMVITESPQLTVPVFWTVTGCMDVMTTGVSVDSPSASMAFRSIRAIF